MIQIHSQTFEGGEPEYLVSLDGDPPEPYSLEALKKAGKDRGIEITEPYQTTAYAYNPLTGQYDIPKRVFYLRPDLIGRRGYHICAKCGGLTRMVLDGEAWCDQCERYQ